MVLRMRQIQKHKHKTLYTFHERETIPALSFLIVRSKKGNRPAHGSYVLFVDSFLRSFTQQAFSEDLLYAMFCEPQTWSLP